jgi:hypothetical protein
MSRIPLDCSKAVALSDYIRNLTDDRRVRDVLRWSSATPSSGKGPSRASIEDRLTKGAVEKTKLGTLLFPVSTYKPAPPTRTIQNRKQRLDSYTAKLNLPINHHTFGNMSGKLGTPLKTPSGVIFPNRLIKVRPFILEKRKMTDF